MKRTMRRVLLQLVLISIAGVAGCAADEGPATDAAPVDAPPPVDTAPPVPGDGPVADTQTADLLAADAAVDGGGTGLPSSCGDSCAAITLTASVAGTSEPFTFAAFGFDLDAAGQAQALRVEAYHGGAKGCPGQSSPTPEQTLIVAGLSLPVDKTPITYAEGLRVTLLDFSGTLLGDLPAAKATAASATFAAARLEPPGDGGRFVAFDLQATLEGGVAVSGRVYAGWCASLDAPP